MFCGQWDWLNANQWSLQKFANFDSNRNQTVTSRMVWWSLMLVEWRLNRSARQPNLSIFTVNLHKLSLFGFYDCDVRAILFLENARIAGNACLDKQTHAAFCAEFSVLINVILHCHSQLMSCYQLQNALYPGKWLGFFRSQPIAVCE